MLGVKQLESKIKQALIASQEQDKPQKISIGFHGVYLHVCRKKTVDSLKWRQRYRIFGKQKDCTHGDYPHLSLSEVKLKALHLKEIVAQGIDPNQQKRLDKIRNASTRPIFSDVANEWLDHKSKTTWRDNLNLNSEKTNRHRLEKHILPVIGKLPLEAIKRDVVTRILRSIEQEGKFDTAKRVMSIIRSIMNYAVDGALIERNPIEGIERTLQKRPKTTGYNFLQFNELPEFLNKLENAKTTEQNKIQIKLLILTMVRPGELRNAKWAEIDIANKLWTIPAERMKSNRIHLVEFLFPGRSLAKPVSEGSIVMTIRRMGYPKEQLHPHGFRKTASTYLNEKGFHRDHIEMQLAHVDGSVRSVYNKAQYMDKRRELMKAYSARMRNS